MPKHRDKARTPLKIFLGHGKEDARVVKGLFRKLKGDGFDPWLASEHLRVGIDWEPETKRQLRSADAAVLCLSASSASRRGFAQTEIRLALDEAKRRPANEVFLIPIALDDCAVPEQLESKHWVSLNQSGGYDRLRLSLLSIKAPSTHRRRQKAALGIDIGSTKIAVGLVDFSRKNKPDLYLTRQRKHADFPKKLGLVERIERVTHDLLEADGRTVVDIEWIGIGLPGMVDAEAGKLRLAPGLNIEEMDVVQKVKDTFFEGLAPDSIPPIFVENDVTCATLAELRFGHGTRHKNFACVQIGTGIGAGIVIDGDLYRGNTLAAGELGHIRVDRRDKDKAYKCNCGSIGCFEEYASARGIVRMAKKWIDREEWGGSNNLAPEDIVAFIQENDSKGRALAGLIAESIAIGLANLANILNPQAIVLGGGIVYGFSEYQDFMKLLRSSFADNVLLACDAEIITTQSRQAAVLGAASLGYRS